MRVLLTGADGMLGTDLTAVLGQRHELITCDIDTVDVTDEAAARDAVVAARPDVIVHAAAYTDVERAEDEPENAFLVNEVGTRNVASAAREAGACLVFYGTDFVFDGTKGAPYTESDQPNPLSVYGRSKLAGERQAQLARRYCIMRTAWLFGPRKANFVEKIVALAKEKDRLKVTEEETGCPTYTLDLARATAWVLDRRLTGVYHVTNAGWCTRLEFAREIVRCAGLDGVVVEPAAPGEFPMKAARPVFGVLSNTAWESSGGPPLRHWREALSEYLAERQDRWNVIQSNKTG